MSFTQGIVFLMVYYLFYFPSHLNVFYCLDDVQPVETDINTGDLTYTLLCHLM